MSLKLTKSALSVQNTLNIFKLDCKVVELPGSTRTAIDAAVSIGCACSQIVKSLIFKIKHISEPVLVLASGSNQVDMSIIEAVLGQKIEKGNADFVKQVTGFAIGGIPPFGHKNIIQFVYIDKDLLEYDEVWAAAGTPHAVFCIKSKDLLKATGAKIVVLSKKE